MFKCAKKLKKRGIFVVTDYFPKDYLYSIDMHSKKADVLGSYVFSKTRYEITKIGSFRGFGNFLTPEDMIHSMLLFHISTKSKKDKIINKIKNIRFSHPLINMA